MDLFFNSTAELQKFVKLSNDFPFDNVKSSIKMAQNRYIKKVMGKELYKKFFDDMTTENKDKLLPYLQGPTSQLALYLYADKGSVLISSGGFYRRESDKEKTAYRYQTESLKMTFLDHGHNLIEELIEFLEDNISLYPEWENSEFYQDNSSIILSSSTELERVNPKYAGRLVYQALLDSIRYVEDFYIRPVLCDYYDELILKKHYKTVDGINYELNPADKIIVSDLLRAITNLAIFQGLPNLSVEINLFGVSLASKDDRNAHLMFQPLDAIGLKSIQSDAKKVAQNYLDKIKKTLHNNIANYPTYEASNCYVPDSSTIRTGNLDQSRPILRDSFFQT